MLYNNMMVRIDSEFSKKLDSNMLYNNMMVRIDSKFPTINNTKSYYQFKICGLLRIDNGIQIIELKFQIKKP